MVELCEQVAKETCSVSKKPPIVKMQFGAIGIFMPISLYHTTKKNILCYPKKLAAQDILTYFANRSLPYHCTPTSSVCSS